MLTCYMVTCGKVTVRLDGQSSTKLIVGGKNLCHTLWEICTSGQLEELARVRQPSDSVVQLRRTSSQTLDSLGDRRMGGKQICEANAAKQGRDDEQVRG